MGERLRKQEYLRVSARLSMENIKRAFFTALCCTILLPVMLVINVFSFEGDTVADIITVFLIIFEVLTIAFAVFSFMAMKKKDNFLELLGNLSSMAESSLNEQTALPYIPKKIKEELDSPVTVPSYIYR